MRNQQKGKNPEKFKKNDETNWYFLWTETTYLKKNNYISNKWIMKSM